jgi:hypothetical protein
MRVLMALAITVTLALACERMACADDGYDGDATARVLVRLH